MGSDDRTQRPAVLPRLGQTALDRALKAMPVVVVMGARQTGKSTLVRTGEVATGRTYRTLDDFDVQAEARTRPDELVRLAPRLTLDEVQREAGLVLAIKKAVDEQRPRRPGQFVLTSSANLLLMQRVSESLAGRAAYVTLGPMTRREQLGLGRAGIWGELLDTPPEAWPDLVKAQPDGASDWRALAQRGGYPTPAYELTDPDARAVWFQGYVQTYLERDLRSLAAIDNLVDFRRLMRLASLRVGRVLNQAEIGRDAGIPRPTVHRYLSLLETSFLATKLEPYAVNRTVRLVKSPKLYWNDTALALHLAGETAVRGEHLENLVATDLLAWQAARSDAPQVMFWRTHEGAEVDFVIEHGDRLLAIEVKAADRVRSDDIRHLRSFAAMYGSRVLGALVLHTGRDVEWMAPGIMAAPWWAIC